jgi:hypothetical protein
MSAGYPIAVLVSSGPPGARIARPALGWAAVVGSFSRSVAGLVAVAAAVLALAPATAPAIQGGATMFVHSARGGELKGGRLMLRGVGRQLAWVTNGSRSGVVPVARLHRRLFPTGTPAATGLLHIAGQRPRRAVALRLSRPRFSASRHQVSYRARPLNGGRGGAALAAVPRRFGAASLTILGDPAVMGGTSGGRDCSVLLLNHTLFDLRVVSVSKSSTDTWGNEIRAGNEVAALTGTIDWQSNGGPLLGCSNTVVWDFPDEPIQPTPPSGTITITTTYPWTAPFTNTCTSSNPQFTCRAGVDNPGQVVWEIRPN